MTQGYLEGSPSGLEVGENLMVRRTLCSKRVDEELVLRISLFKSKCKMVEKCCKVIVDSSSSIKFSLEELVTKL